MRTGSAFSPALIQLSECGEKLSVTFAPSPANNTGNGPPFSGCPYVFIPNSDSFLWSQPSGAGDSAACSHWLWSAI